MRMRTSNANKRRRLADLSLLDLAHAGIFAMFLALAHYSLA